MTPTRSERPTVPPSFDVAQYAKDSDARLSVARAAALPREEPDVEEGIEVPPTPRSEVRLLTRPSFDAIVTDEAWARSVRGALYVAIPREQLKRLPLGHRAGFLLSCVDGATDLETLIAVSAMPREETLRLARDLFESGVVAIR